MTFFEDYKSPSHVSNIKPISMVFPPKKILWCVKLKTGGIALAWFGIIASPIFAAVCVGFKIFASIQLVHYANDSEFLMWMTVWSFVSAAAVLLILNAFFSFQLLLGIWAVSWTSSKLARQLTKFLSTGQAKTNGRLSFHTRILCDLLLVGGSVPCNQAWRPSKHLHVLRSRHHLHLQMDLHLVALRSDKEVQMSRTYNSARCFTFI